MLTADRAIELTKLIQSRMNECEAMKNKAQSENRHLTDEEISKYGEFLADVEVYTKELELEKREMSARDNLNRSTASRIIKPDGTVLDELQAKYPGLPPKGQRFDMLGEFLQAIHRVNGGMVDTRLRAAATGMSEGTPTDGGFALQTDFSTELLNRVYTESQVPKRVKRMSLGTNSNSIDLPIIAESSRVSSIWGGIVMYWLDEAAAKTPTKPEMGKLALKLKKVAGLLYMTDELIQDASFLSTYANNGFREALDVELERVIVRGTGVGQPLGILLSPCLITVDKEVGQLADTILAENVVNMFARMYPSGLQNAVWLRSQSILPQLMFMTMPGIPNYPLWMPAGGLSAAPYETLIGKPMFAIENCSALGDLGDLIFADFSQYLLIDKGGVQTASSIHVKFVNDETAFRIVYRCDGQPIWPSALTPKDNSSTVSPFITLEAR